MGQERPPKLKLFFQVFVGARSISWGHWYPLFRTSDDSAHEFQSRSIFACTLVACAQWSPKSSLVAGVRCVETPMLWKPPRGIWVQFSVCGSPYGVSVHRDAVLRNTYASMEYPHTSSWNCHRNCSHNCSQNTCHNLVTSVHGSLNIAMARHNLWW